jgi:hypothetical protein
MVTSAWIEVVATRCDKGLTPATPTVTNFVQFAPRTKKRVEVQTCVLGEFPAVANLY